MKYLILITSIFILSSCVTPQKCNDKFPPKPISSDTTENIVDTNVVVDLVGKTDPTSFESWWLDNNDFTHDTVIVIKYDTINNTITIESKAGKTKVKCQTDSLVFAIKDYVIKLQNKQTVITNLEQVYFDQKQENKQLKIENNKLKILTKADVKKASSDLWANVAKVVKWSSLIFFILFLLFLAINYLPKPRR